MKRQNKLGRITLITHHFKNCRSDVLSDRFDALIIQPNHQHEYKSKKEAPVSPPEGTHSYSIRLLISEHKVAAWHYLVLPLLSCLYCYTQGLTDVYEPMHTCTLTQSHEQEKYACMHALKHLPAHKCTLTHLKISQFPSYVFIKAFLWHYRAASVW